MNEPSPESTARLDGACATVSGVTVTEEEVEPVPAALTAATRTR
nr:hypothetical protein [Kineosporia mesophila]